MKNVIKIGVVGPESTAKSTLSSALSAHFDGEYIEEYARVYVEGLSRPYTYFDVEIIAHHQILEQTVEAKKWIQFFDTELIITKVWFEHKWGNVPTFVLDALGKNPIDFYLLCAPDLPFENDPLRENPHLRDYLFAWYEREIKALGIPFAVVSGVGQDRVKNAIQAVEVAVLTLENARNR